MPSARRHFYEFGPFRVDPERHRLLRQDEPVPLSPKVFETLLTLVRSPGQVLEREELLKIVWEGTFVEDANLTVAISNLRKALSQDAETTEYIQTIPRVGYRFLVDVRVVEETPKPLIVEKHTLSRTIIEEEEVSDEPAAMVFTQHRTAIQWRLSQVAPVVVLVLIATAGLFYFKGTSRHTAFASTPLNLPIRSIAVLPPKSLTVNTDDSSLSLGVTDALITRLGGVRNLTVRPTSSSIRYLNTSQDPLDVGRTLRVDAVIEGSLQRENSRVRMTLRMINVANGSQLWAGNFEEADEDIFKLQDSLSQEVATQLFGELSAPEREHVTHRQTRNPQAYAAYVQGKYLWGKRGSQIVNSIPYYRKAIELDNQFAEAYVGLATVYACSSIPSPEAEALLDRALQLNDSLAEAHATNALIKMFHHWDWDAAEKELDRAFELDPNSVSAHHWKGVYLSLRGQLEEAKAEMHQALLLDPTSSIILSDIGQLHYFSHEYDQALEYCNRALALDPQSQITYYYLFDIYRAKGMEREAISAMLKADALGGVNRSQETVNLLTSASLNSFLTMRNSDYSKLSHEDQMINAIVLARSYLQLKDYDRALQWLERITQRRSFGVPYIAIDPIYDPIRANPRFQAALQQVHLN